MKRQLLGARVAAGESSLKLCEQVLSSCLLLLQPLSVRPSVRQEDPGRSAPPAPPLRAERRQLRHAARDTPEHAPRLHFKIKAHTASGEDMRSLRGLEVDKKQQRAR